MKPNRLDAFDFLAGLRACGLAGLRACGLAGLRACGLALLVAIAPSVWAQSCTYFDAFKDNRDGTVTDPRSGTVWQRCAVGQTWNGSGCTGDGSAMLWWEAMRAAKASRFLGKADWRIPTVEEAVAIVGVVDDCRYNKDQRAVSPFFGSVDTKYKKELGFFWLSSPDESEKDKAMVVGFEDARFLKSTRWIKGATLAKLVRAGQPTARAEFNREFAKIGQLEAEDAERIRLRLQGYAAADRQQQAAQNAASQQRSGDYENLIVSRTAFGNRYSARCRSGGFGNVSKQDAERSICFWLEGGSTRCEVIDVEAAMRKACAD